MKKFITLVLCWSLAALPITQSLPVAHAQDSQLKEQIATDLVGAGISIGAALSGNVPLAFAAGYLTKYISTYGIAGVRALIDYFKGHRPGDLGEINLYYLYLLHIKRNLYHSLLNIRKTVQEDVSLSHIERQLEKVEQSLSGKCADCEDNSTESQMVNLQVVNLLIDARSSLDLSRYLQRQEIRGTYQYLVLLYLDLLIVEQKLIEAQSEVMHNRVAQGIQAIRDNPYLSKAEKEYQKQLLMNLGLRWMLLADKNRLILAEAARLPIQNLKNENDELEKKLDDYRGDYQSEAL